MVRKTAKYKVTLTDEERMDLEVLISAGKSAARKLCRARILLKADAGPGGPAWNDGRISEALEVNTHSPASLYDTFEPSEARRLAEKLAIHYTPKHGSWLDMAEIEIGILSRQCLNRRIDDAATLRREVVAWENDRNRRATKVNWRFTTANARIKLRRLYPSIE